MIMQNKLGQRSLLLTILLLVFVSFVPIFVAHRFPLFLNDDSYISLTYAKNLASGNGFVFNNSPAFLGTTTPLFTITVAGLAIILPGIDIPLIAVYLSAYCLFGLIWIFFFFRQEWGLENWQVCILAIILIGSGWVNSFGMEAYPFAFLLVLSLSIFLSGRYWFTGFIIALLFLMRGEGVLVVALLTITLFIQHWVTRKSFVIELVRNILKLLVGFMLPVILWAIYAHFTFGSLLPNTLVAKQAQGHTGLWLPFLQRLTYEWIPSWGRSFKIEVFPYINFWWVIVVIGFLDVIIRKRKWLIFVGWLIFYISGYILLNVSAYWWYQIPILFVLNLLFGLGIIKIVEILTIHIKSNYLSVGLSVLLTFVLVFVLAKPTFDNMLTFRGDARGESYSALCSWFDEKSNSSESIAFIEIGYLGYFTDNRIIDLAGLVLPDIVPHIAEGDFSWGFWEYKPDYYVYLSDFDWALAGIKADSRFDQQYRLVATLPGPRESDFIIYARITQ